MRILIYTHEFVPWSGGIAIHNLELAQGLAVQGHDVWVLAPKYSDNGPALQSAVYRVWRPFPDKGFKPYKILASITSLFIAWLRHQPDVILVTNSGAYRCMALVTLLFPLPFVLVLHGSEVLADFDTRRHSRLYRLLMRRLYRRAKALIAVSRSTRELVVSRVSEVGEKVFVVYSVIADPLQKRSGQQQIAELRKRLGLAKEDKVLLTVARLSPGKGQDNVIRALPKVLRQMPNIKYVVVGSGTCERELRLLADAEGVSSVVQFVGNVPRERVWAYYKMSDLFVMPSRRGKQEGFAKVYIEAAACGNPAIGGRGQGGTDEFIVDDVTGILVDSDDPDEIANAILRILTDPGNASRMGEQARKRFEAHFSVQVMVEETLKVVAQRVTGAN